MDSRGDLDAMFRAAVGALDAGDEASLTRMLDADPRLARARLDSPGAWLREVVGRAVEPGGFFERPYLLWFVAEDPVRNGTLPQNIARLAQRIVRAGDGAVGGRERLDHALRLVVSSWIARECGVQRDLIDVLLEAGASPEGMADCALVNANFSAAEHLVRRGAALTLATALCVESWGEANRLLAGASERQKRFAVVVAALHGKSDALRRLIEAGVELNRPSEDLYPHGSPVHHAVSSGSLEVVRLLVEAGADCDAKDTAWGGTPLDWADHYAHDGNRNRGGRQYDAIANYLRGLATTT